MPTAAMHPTSGWELALALVLPVGSHLLVSAASVRKGDLDYFQRLRKPVWAPSILSIQIAWNCLLALLGVASWMVFREGGLVVQATPLAFYALALLLSLAWGPLFVRWRLMDWALADACLLLAAVLAMFLEFAKVLGLVATSILLGPLVLWTAAGVLLNYAVLRMAGGADSEGRGMLT